MTPKQNDLINKIYNEITAAVANVPEEHAADLLSLLTPIKDDLVACKADPDSVDSRQASAVIDTLIKASKLTSNLVPPTEFRNVKHNGAWVVRGPAGHENTEVITTAHGDPTRYLGKAVGTDGAATLYESTPPWEMEKQRKAEEQAAADAAEAAVKDRLAALHARFGTRSLRLAWESTGSNDLTFKAFHQVRVAEVVGGHGEVPMKLSHMESALDKAEAMSDDEVREAAARFGQELDACGRCGRDLTDRVSRACGVGPECRSKDGWTRYADLASEYHSWFLACDDAGFTTNEAAAEVAEAIAAGLSAPLVDEAPAMFEVVAEATFDPETDELVAFDDEVVDEEGNTAEEVAAARLAEYRDSEEGLVALDQLADRISTEEDLDAMADETLRIANMTPEEREAWLDEEDHSEPSDIAPANLALRFTQHPTI